MRSNTKLTWIAKRYVYFEEYKKARAKKHVLRAAVDVFSFFSLFSLPQDVGILFPLFIVAHLFVALPRVARATDPSRNLFDERREENPAVNGRK